MVCWRREQEKKKKTEKHFKDQLKHQLFAAGIHNIMLELPWWKLNNILEGREHQVRSRRGKKISKKQLLSSLSPDENRCLLLTTDFDYCMSVNKPEKSIFWHWLECVLLLDLHSERGVHRHLFTHHRGEGELLHLFIKKKKKPCN